MSHTARAGQVWNGDALVAVAAAGTVYGAALELVVVARLVSWLPP